MIGRIINLYNKYYSILLNVLLVLLVITVAADPKNLILGLKYYIFMAIFLIWSPQLVRRKINIPRKLWFIIFVICFVMPFYGISIGLVNSFTNNIGWGKEIIYFTSFFFFLLIIPLLHSGIDLSYKFNITTLIIVVLTISIYVVLLFLPASAKILFQYLVTETGTAAFGHRSYGSINILMVWYRTSPLLVFPLTFFLHQLLVEKNRSNFILKSIVVGSIVFTLLLSGTRANLLAVILILFIYTNIFFLRNYKKLFILFNSVAFVAGLYLLSDVLLIFFSKDEPSIVIKMGHLLSYINHFTQNPIGLIFGQGIGLPFYTTGFHQEVFATELQYFEMIRIWGLPLTILFIGVLLLPLINNLQTKTLNHVSISYLAFLFIAGTNPFLLDSTGMIVLVYVFSNLFSQNRLTQITSHVH